MENELRKIKENVENLSKVISNMSKNKSIKSMAPQIYSSRESALANKSFQSSTQNIDDIKIESIIKNESKFVEELGQDIINSLEKRISDII